MTTFFAVLSALIVAGLGITIKFFKRGGIYNPVTSLDNETHIDIVPEAQNSPIEPVPTPEPIVPKYLWDTPENTRHSVRVICDESGLTVQEKNLICAVIKAESGFYNTAVNYNKNSKGVVTSTDWGICQINDRFHIGKGKTFPTVDYVLQNPDKVVRWMIEMYRKGNLSWWCAFTNGSYKKYL